MQDHYDPLAAYRTDTPVASAFAWLGKPQIRLGIALILVLCAAVAALYGRGLHYPFVFDDRPFFTEVNLHHYGVSLFHFDLRWLAYASLGWTYQLFGMDIPALRWGNIILHGITASLLFVFFVRLLQLTAVAKESKPAIYTAFLLALAFAVHPVGVYSVAYLIERSIIMTTLFSIASLLCYLEGVSRERGKLWLSAAVAFYFLAVFSKEHSVMLPAVAALLSILLRTSLRDIVRKTWGAYLGYAIVGLFIVLRSKGVLGSPYEPYALSMLAQMSEYNGGVMPEHVYLYSVISQSYLFFKYLLLWLLPNPGWMAIDLRQHFPEHLFSWPEFPGFIAFIIYPVIAVWLLRQGGRRGLAGFAMLAPWLLFFTELVSVRLQEPFVLYRSYLWMSVLPLLLVGIFGVLDNYRKQLAMLAACAMLAFISWGRIGTFADPIMLWTDAVNKNTDTRLIGSERALTNRGYALMQAGQLAAARRDVTAALAINPQQQEANFDMAVLDMNEGKADEALALYAKTIALKPDFADAWLNRGYLQFRLGRLQESIADYNHALQLQPENADALLDRGLSYAALGQTDAALTDMNQAINLAPGNAQAWLNRGIVYAQQHQAQLALADMNTAIRLAPGYAPAYYNRGYLALINGQRSEAARDLQAALAINPNYTEALVQLATLHILDTQYDTALSLLDRAIALQPQAAPLYVTRGAVQAGLQHNDAALQDYEHAIQLAPDNYRAQLSKGMLLVGLNRRSEAMPALQAVCRLDQGAACAKAKQLMADGGR
jgi:protein O-mannosyl-transferase